MKIVERLDQWKKNGAITGARLDAISPLVRKDLFSVFIELNGLLYLGVLSFVAGVGWTIQQYFANLGDAAIISALTLLFFLSLYDCFSRALPWSPQEVESPNMAFDYVLYAGCLVLALELGYLETRFHLLQDYWDFYLLFSSLLFFALAYRFDNRLVFSMALSTLAGWFGIRLSRFAFNYGESLRPYALAYGVIVAGMGGWLYRNGIKKHFIETSLHIAANIMFIALISGARDASGTWLYFAGLLGLAAVAIVGGVRLNRFAFVAYGTIHGYIGISIEVLRNSTIDSTFALSYLIISGSLVILSMILLARLFGRTDLNDTIRRLQAYQEAGADVLYAPGLVTREDIAAVVRSVDRPVNVLMGLQSARLSLAELSEIGVKRVSGGGSLCRTALGAFLRAAREMQERGTFTFTAEAASYREISAMFEG